MIGLGESLIQRLNLNGARFVNSIRYSSFLGHLNPAEGSVHNYKKLGRGASSGKGKTAGRGQKGQRARGSVPIWFEGGQTPYYKRFPIFGMKRPHAKQFNELNMTKIQDFWDTGRIPLKENELLTIRVMKECGLITGTLKDGVKLLAEGAENYSVPLNIEVSKASLTAIAAVEKLGKEITTKYFTKLSLKAHIDPDYFLLTRGYVPLPARPTHRRDIDYYSNQEKRGYLDKDRSILLDLIGDRTRTARKVSVKENPLLEQLKNASSKKYEMEENIVKLSDL
ncbi:MRPL10 [[Candida] subhashii]|uniref:MRPL10 n=1 Tax=[Candida] subhashii TaxID=561895 RepID=A0A8J5QS39_9ASCO|nr:MRPL10 [[Candida] subhashii]KAG7665904.1 MRPL10 [[Candida] subhashii]